MRAKWLFKIDFAEVELIENHRAKASKSDWIGIIKVFCLIAQNFGNKVLIWTDSNFNNMRALIKILNFNWNFHL